MCGCSVLLLHSAVLMKVYILAAVYPKVQAVLIASMMEWMRRLL